LFRLYSKENGARIADKLTFQSGEELPRTFLYLSSTIANETKILIRIETLISRSPIYAVQGLYIYNDAQSILG
jgi:hypothetical protein